MAVNLWKSSGTLRSQRSAVACPTWETVQESILQLLFKKQTTAPTMQMTSRGEAKKSWVAKLESLSERIGHLSPPHQQIPQVFHPQQAWEACMDVVLQVKVIDKLDSDPACASSCASNDPRERKSSMLHNFIISRPHLSAKAHGSPQVLSLPLLAWPFQRDQSLPHDPQSRINFNVSLSNMTTIQHMAPFTVPYSHRGRMHLHILVSLMSQESFAKSWKTWWTWTFWFYIPMEGKGRVI